MDHPHPANIKEEGHDFLQGLMNNPLVHEVAHNIGETLSAHLHKQEDHNGNPDDIEPVFEKINADDKKKDNLIGHDHLSEPVHSSDHHVDDLLGEVTHAPTVSEHHKVEGENKPAASIEDFLSGDLSSLVGELTKSVFDTVKEHVATKTPESTPRTESPQPTTEVFDIKKEDESQHLPQEPIHHFSDHQEKKGDNGKVEDLMNHHSHPDEPETPKKDNYSNISIPKVDVIAASPIPSTSPIQDELPAEPIHPKQPTDFQKKERVVDDNVEDEIACVKLKGYTVEGEIHQESHPVHEPHHVIEQHPVVESQLVDEPHHVVGQHPVADQHPEEEYSIHEQHPVVEVVPHAPEHHEAEKKDFPVKEIQAESHDFKEEFVQKPEVVHESTQEHVDEVKKEVIKEEAKVEEVKKEEAKVEEVKKEEAKVEEVTKEEAKVEEVVGKVVSKNLAKDVAKKIADSKMSSKPAPKPATTKPAIQPAARQLPKAAPAKPAPARAAPTPRPPPARVAPTPRPAPVRAAPTPRPAPVRTAPAPRPSSTTSTDKVPSYARPTATSSRSSIASKTPTSTINSKTTSISSTSEIKPLPKIANKYKDVKSRVFSTTTATPSTPSPPKPRPTTSTRLSSGGSNGIKPLPKSNLVWKVESKVNSFANINHKPAGGVIKTKPPPPTTKIGNVSVDVPGNINPVSTSEALGN